MSTNDSQTDNQDPPADQDSPRSPIRTAIMFGLAATLAHLFYHIITNDPHPGDFVSALRVAYTLLNGIDPYNFTPDPLFVPYPLPIALFGLPFVWVTGVLPFYAAGAMFIGISTGLLAWAMLRAGENFRLAAIMLSGPYWVSVVISQWSPLIVAAWFLPVLAPLLVLVKPHIALPVFAARMPSRLGLLIAACVLLASLIIYPTWPFRFLSMVGPFQSAVPVLTLPLGPLLLFAALAWRDERARLLLLMALVPQRAVYDFLPLWLVPKDQRGLIILTALSWLVVLAGVPTWPAMITWPDIRWAIHVLYLPLLAIVLWPLFSSRFSKPTPAVATVAET